MECNQIIAALKDMSSEKYKANVVRLGIPEESSIGTSTGDIRKLAKTLRTSNKLAYELWSTSYHEAKLLAVLLFDKKSLTIEDIENLMEDVFSWDLCDHICKNLIIKVKGYDLLINRWCDNEKTYFKRAAFTLMASVITHDKNVSDKILASFLDIIKEQSNDDRDHVKKAVSWALRESGKKDFNYQEKAIILAYELKETGNKAQLWVAKDALKELETLVQVKGRGRLISSETKMGKEQLVVVLEK